MKNRHHAEIGAAVSARPKNPHYHCILVFVAAALASLPPCQPNPPSLFLNPPPPLSSQFNGQQNLHQMCIFLLLLLEQHFHVSQREGGGIKNRRHVLKFARYNTVCGGDVFCPPPLFTFRGSSRVVWESFAYSLSVAPR